MFFYEPQLMLIAAVGLLVFGSVAVAGGRGEPDPSGARPYAVYLTAITFVAVFVMLFSAYGVVREVIQIGLGTEVEAVGFDSGGGVSCTVSSDGSEECVSSFEPLVGPTGGNDDVHISGAVRAALIGVAGLGLLLLHRSRLAELLSDQRTPASPAGRIALIHSYFVTFLAAVIGLIAASIALYSLFRVVAPDVTGTFADEDLERDRGIISLLSAGSLVIGSWWLYIVHSRRAETIRGVRSLAKDEDD